MPRGKKTARLPGKSRYVLASQLPCGREYSGEVNRTENLVRIHQKMCDICRGSIHEEVDIGGLDASRVQIGDIAPSLCSILELCD